ncbi:replication protein A 32 kDa subunit isoform X2 [Astyanax mexicanus]|uniref:replication protein A 32 kDa subunit isoform X2 n=1 Tax=Astyanax mexicanus TaxID=7994 RepID=UPI0020CACB41|nr:replication protein A 32 kDa subunit isoform X2 [Astyanax mexicanus]
MGSHGYRCRSSPGESSFSPYEGKSKRSRILCMMPCTVSQLRSASEQKDSFFINGLEINQVSVVGIIRKYKPYVAYVVYTLDDMTGAPLDVKQWVDLEDASMNSYVIPPGSYIKVVGSLRSFQHQRSLVAFSIRRLEDLNEITSHMLEVVQAHLLNISSSCSAVFNLIKSCSLAEGISVQNLRTALKYMSLYDIRNSLQFLINEGHIFSTVDENHFKATY